MGYGTRIPTHGVELELGSTEVDTPHVLVPDSHLHGTLVAHRGGKRGAREGIGDASQSEKGSSDLHLSY